MNKEQEALMGQFIRELPANCREACRLFFLEGIPRKQICLRLQLSKSNIQNKIAFGSYLIRKKFLKLRAPE